MCSQIAEFISKCAILNNTTFSASTRTTNILRFKIVFDRLKDNWELQLFLRKTTHNTNTDVILHEQKKYEVSSSKN